MSLDFILWQIRELLYHPSEVYYLLPVIIVWILLGAFMAAKIKMRESWKQYPATVWTVTVLIWIGTLLFWHVVSILGLGYLGADYVGKLKKEWSAHETK